MEPLARPASGRSSVVEALLRTEFVPVTPAEDETPFEKVINELVATECTYVVNLRLVLEVYYWPLRNLLKGPEVTVMSPEIAIAFAEFTEPVLNADELNKLYGCLEQLFPVNAGLLKDFQSAQQIPKDLNSEPNPESLYNNIGKLFNRFVHFFKMYSMYCCAYESSATLLAELLTAEKYAKFQHFCSVSMNLPRVGGATLASFLIQPVQRIPRYIMLFQQLVKHAPTSNHTVHETLRKELQAALKEASAVATRINEEVRARKNRDEIMALSAQFWGDDPQFIGPSRRLIRQGPLVRECRGGNKPFTFFLFNDTLAYAEKLVIGKYKLHRKIPIDDSFTLNSDLEEYRSSTAKVHAAEVASLQKTFRVFFTNEQHKLEWVDDIEDQIDELKLQRARKRTSDVIPSLPSSTSSAVRMLPHSPDSTCFGCSTTFTLLRPAVNCVLCGQIFCKKCTKQQVVLNVAKRGTTGESQGEKENVKSRSCEPCAQARLAATRERLRMKSHQSRTLGWSGLYEAMGVERERKDGSATDFGEVLSYVPRTDIEKQLSTDPIRARSMTDPTHTEHDAPPLEPADGTSVYDSAMQDLLGRRARPNRIKPEALSVFEQLEFRADQLSNLQKDRKAFNFDPSSVRPKQPPPPVIRKTSSGASSPPPPPAASPTISDILRSKSPGPRPATPSTPSKDEMSDLKTPPPPNRSLKSPISVTTSTPSKDEIADLKTPPSSNRSLKTPTSTSGKKITIPKYATIGHSPRKATEDNGHSLDLSEIEKQSPSITVPTTPSKLGLSSVTPKLSPLTPSPRVAESTSTRVTPKLEKSASDDLQATRVTCENCQISITDAKFCPSCGHKVASTHDATPKSPTIGLPHSTPKSATIGGKIGGHKSTDILAASRARSPRSHVAASSSMKTPVSSSKTTPRGSPATPPVLDDLLSKPVARVQQASTSCPKCKTLRSGERPFCNSCGHKFT